MAEPPSAVYDTNVLVSVVLALARGRSESMLVRCWELVLDGSVRLCTSAILLDEFARVLQRPRIGELTDRAWRYADLVAQLATIVEPPDRLSILTIDPDDNRVLECASAANATFLVTGNAKHFEELGRDADGALCFGGTRIITPRELLRGDDPG